MCWFIPGQSKVVLIFLRIGLYDLADHGMI